MGTEVRSYAKRRRSYSSDVDDESECNQSKAWNDPEILLEMGLGLLSDDAPSYQETASEEDVFQLPTSDDDFSENTQKIKQTKKKRKLNGQHREPLRQQQQQQILVHQESAREDLRKDDLKKAEKLSPPNIIIRNSQVVQINNNDDSIVCNNEVKEEECEFTISKAPLNSSENDSGPDYFSMLPDELILGIFRLLDRKFVTRCCLVSKRFLRIAGDDSLWGRVDAGGKIFPVGGVGYMLRRDPFIVRMASTCVPDPVILPGQLPENYVSKITYLDLSMAIISPSGLSSILQYCKRLKKLSIENCMLSNDVAVAISTNKNLEVLNLTMCSKISPTGLHAILTNCDKLLSLNLSWTHLSPKTIRMFADYVPCRLERLNLSGCREKISDDHVIKILDRCDNLKELDISDGIELSEKVIDYIVKEVSNLEYLAVSRCYSIPITCLTQLKRVKSLNYLDLFGLCSELELKQLRRALPDISLNQFMFSSVARPTVGLRRTSIWGLRVRD